MTNVSRYSESSLFKMLAESKEQNDLDVLASLFDTIQITDRFENLDRAFRRLVEVLQKLSSVNPQFNTEEFSRWQETSKSLIKILSKYIKNNKNDLFVSVTLVKGSKTSLLESNIESKHPFYAALIVECSRYDIENSLINLLSIMLGGMIINKSQRITANNQLTKELLELKNAAKKIQRNNDWQDFLIELLFIGDEGTFNSEWLFKLTDKCRNLKKSNKLNQGQKEFIAALSQFIGILLSAPEPNIVKSQKENKTQKKIITNKPRSIKIEHLQTPLFSIRQLVHKPSPTENFDDEALAPEDWQEQIDFICTPELSAEESPLSEQSEKIAIQFTQYYYEQNNQYLPVLWSSLNPYELNQLREYLASDLTTGLRLSRAAQSLISLVMTTGQSLSVLLSFELNNPVSEEKPHSLIKQQGRWYWQHRIPELRESYQPKGEIRNLVNPVDNSLTLPLPKLIDRLLAEVTDHQTGNLMELYNFSESELLQEISTVFSRLNSNRRCRITLTRLRRVLFDSLMQVRGDELAAYTLLGLNDDRPLTGLYYTAFTVTELVALYCQGIERLLPASSSADYLFKPASFASVGSRLSVSPETFIRFVSELQKRCDELLRGSRSRDRIIEAHNIYTAYTVLLLQFSSGHRAVNDPFFDPDGFVLDGAAALITDKVELVEHEGRLVCLGIVASAQLRNYRKHLIGLQSALSKYSTRLVALIDSLITANAQRLIPYLFFLKAPTNDSDIQWLSVTPSTLKGILQDSWPFPLNINRHLLATELRRLDVSAEYISYQLGHVQTGQFAYGRFALLAPSHVASVLIPALTKLEALYGWKEIKGLRPYTEPQRIAKGKLPEPRKFGPQLRQFKRERAESDAKVVLQAMVSTAKEFKLPDTVTEVPQVFIDAVLNKIKENAVPIARQMRRQNLFYRYLRIGRHQKHWQTTLPAQLFVLNNEKASLSYLDGSDLAKLQVFKRHFLNWLIGQFMNDQFPLSIAESDERYLKYLAACRLSALLFGQLCQPAYLEQLEMALCQHANGKNGRFWVNFFDRSGNNGKLNYRWQPDAMTTVLLLKSRPWLLKTNTGHDNFKELSTSIEKNLKKLLLSLAKECGLHDHLASNPLKKLLLWVRKDNALHFPGAVRAFLNQEIENWPLPEVAWLRLITEETAGNYEITIEEQTAANFSPILVHKPKPGDDEQALKDLRTCLHHALPPSAGRNTKTNLSTTSDSRRKHLIQAFAKWNETWKDHVSPTLYALQGWLVQLLSPKDGSKPLKPSSVLTYLNAFGSALLEECGATNLSLLDEDQIYEIYERVILAGKESSQGYRVDRLISFHDYLVNHHGAPALDFSELPTVNSSYAADANIVTPREYKIAFNLLRNDPHQTRTTQVQQALALCLLYRNGLRVMEIFKLQLCDVVAEPPERLYIRNNALGTSKTINGVRQIPFWQRLDHEEQALLTDWLSHFSMNPNLDAHCPLLSEPTSGKLANRYVLTERMVTALRLATGDPSVKLRHLRHSFATYFFSAACERTLSAEALTLPVWSGHNPHVAGQFHHEIFGQNIATRKSLYQLASLMGHSSPATTLRNYIHSLDWLVPYYRPPLPESLTGEVIMKLLGHAPGSLQTTAARMNLFVKDLRLDHLLENLIKKSFKGPEQKANPPQALAMPKLPIIEKTLPTLTEFAQLLSLHQKGLQLDWLANRYDINAETIKLCFESAILTQKRSHYRHLGLDQPVETDWPSLIDTPPEKIAVPFPKQYQPVTRNTLFVENLEQALKKPNKDLRKLANLWEQGYQLKSSAYYFKNQTDTLAWVNLLVKFGIDINCIFLEIPANTVDFYQNNSPKISKLLKELEIPEANITLKKSQLKSAKLQTQLFTKNLKLGIAIAKPNTSNTDEIKPKPKFNTAYLNYYLFFTAALLNVKKLTA